MAEWFHEPIMSQEVIRFLDPRPGAVYVDGTVGGGGHAKAIAECLTKDDRMVVIDLDPAALAHSRQVLADVAPNVYYVAGDWKQMPEHLDQLGIESIGGCLLDLGISSHQIDHPTRGFSYRFPEAPLDMRMNPDATLTAADILNRYDEAELRRLFYRYGEERWAPKIARAIVAQREEHPFERVEDLVRIVEACVPRHLQSRSGHPARKVFQSLRIEVNQELVDVEDALRRIIHLLQPDGTFVVITFHSLEDRAVKRVFREYAKECRCPPELPICQCDGPLVKELQRKPLQASDDELTHNPRASSAKLRAVQRLTTDQ